MSLCLPGTHFAWTSENHESVAVASVPQSPSIFSKSLHPILSFSGICFCMHPFVRFITWTPKSLRISYVYPVKIPSFMMPISSALLISQGPLQQPSQPSLHAGHSRCSPPHQRGGLRPSLMNLQVFWRLWILKRPYIYIMLYHIIFFMLKYIILDHIIPYHIKSYHFISFHIISYHVISYDIILHNARWDI